MKKGTLEILLYIANSVGEVEKVNMYDKNTLFIEGKTESGNGFNLSLTIKKEKENND